MKFRRGFTLIELMVVISIISLLSTVVLASLSQARDKARIAAAQQFDNNMYHTFGSELVGYWPLDEVSGTVVSDAAGVNTGARRGTVSVVSGAIRKAASFDGNAANYIEITNSESIQMTGNQTISLWLYPTSFAARRNPIAKAYGGEGTITQELNGTLSYYYGTAGANNAPYQGAIMTSPLPLNKWTHVVLIRDLKNMKLYWYKDGKLVNTYNALYPAATVSPLNLFIGKGYTSAYSGYIDEVKLYGDAIDVAQVEKLYTEGLRKMLTLDMATHE